MEDNRVGNKELLVAWSNKRCKKIYRWLWYVLEDEELNRDTSGKAEVEWDTRKAMDTLNSRLYN